MWRRRKETEILSKAPMFQWNNQYANVRVCLIERVTRLKFLSDIAEEGGTISYSRKARMKSSAFWSDPRLVASWNAQGKELRETLVAN